MGNCLFSNLKLIKYDKQLTKFDYYSVQTNLRIEFQPKIKEMIIITYNNIGMNNSNSPININ